MSIKNCSSQNWRTYLAKPAQNILKSTPSDIIEQETYTEQDICISMLLETIKDARVVMHNVSDRNTQTMLSLQMLCTHFHVQTLQQQLGLNDFLKQE